MIVVMQCAASKRAAAGHLLSSRGEPVRFVANPAIAPADPYCVYARPDDLSSDGKSWRRILLDCNRDPGRNAFHLYPAYQLYENDLYGRFVDRFGLENVFILSAGWGLIRADFLTPSYDITF